MRVLFSGGGTGGHIYPALAVSGALTKDYPGVELLYVGTPYGLESKLVPREGIRFKTVNVSGLKRKLSLDTIVWAGQTTGAAAQAVKLLKEFRPDVVVGTGGYVCAPVILAAAVLRVPSILHEQNAFPGKTNRWLAPFAQKILVNFAESKQYFGRQRGKVITTGLPVRREIIDISRKKGAEILGVSPDRLTLMVVGGSQGAKSINQAVLPLAAKVAANPRLQLIWATGESQYDWVIERLQQDGIKSGQVGNITIKPYLHQVAAALATADLIISRAGATFLAEITARGIASILVPYPYATDNHQEYNARSLVKKGAALMVADEELSKGILVDKVEDLLSKRKVLETMSQSSQKCGKPEALEQIVKEIVSCISV
ncbi:undecaprenyldiphospho-muramoylpentapeptide beta-N-acetylglucosaminyltransferase [Metallumcola ferriviriculae]|uniref:UDP-N-acetylglucosamine--N-acetylmuramyl-(pentapeptide) pyrophosphoryl-undecaprenol N-acetylglucosamine transferase n=1 Tax=Metallumcola ferriviriculae TaxID=3039180 RepID=A0AAU0UMI6_9FIRM|nr:undecaprenyldiphospho-muramoylpentapeptide beta-N-acetylglucosaminyltransferase [Desulfitibacteraceae bacterium MK1]